MIWPAERFVFDEQCLEWLAGILQVVEERADV
jgi:hypothetical protein